MIPKIIHYCWFGKGRMPKSQRNCIKGWKKLMPNYTFMLWDEKSFNIDYCPFTKEAYSKKKYAYVADVARLCALQKYGGVYLDTDVELFKNFDQYLNYDFFTGIELYREFEKEHVAERLLNEDGTPKQINMDIPHLEVLTSTMGSCPQSPLIAEVLEYYNAIEITEDLINNFRKYVNFDRLMARHLTHYGFRYINETQYLDKNMVVFGTGIFGHAFCPDERFDVSWHYNEASWLDNKKKNWMKELLRELGLLKLLKAVKNFKSQTT